MIQGVKVTRLKVIRGDLGSVMHAMKKSDDGFKGFGEAYFSSVNKDCIKGWGRHRIATLNIVVPFGEIKFVIYDDRPESKTHGEHNEFFLSARDHCRLIVPPMVWMAFEGLEDVNILLDIMDIEHDDNEKDELDLESIPYSGW